MRLSSLRHRRSSPAIVISSVALFMSMGGVGYAAYSVPTGSVGTAQLRNGAVTNSKLHNNSVSYKKIVPGSVGIVRANTGQLQVRVSRSCSAGSAIGAIDRIGHVTCNPALPAEKGTTDNTATVGGTATTLNSTTLAAGSSYMAFADPTATVTSGATAQQVTETCTLTVGSDTQSRSVIIRTDGTAGDKVTAAIPMQLAGTSGTAAVSCTSAVNAGALPAVSVTSALNALQTASNS